MSLVRMCGMDGSLRDAIPRWRHIRPALFASCLAEGGVGADGWEDELNVKKAVESDKKRE